MMQKNKLSAELWLGSVKEYDNAIVIVLENSVSGSIIDRKRYCGKTISKGKIIYMMNYINPYSFKLQNDAT